jgi:hypothetical protein
MATAAARNASLCIALISVVAEWWGQGERGKKTATPFENIFADPCIWGTHLERDTAFHFLLFYFDKNS